LNTGFLDAAYLNLAIIATYFIVIMYFNALSTLILCSKILYFIEHSTDKESTQDYISIYNNKKSF